MDRGEAIHFKIPSLSFKADNYPKPEYPNAYFVKDTDKIQNLRLSANRVMIMQAIIEFRILLYSTHYPFSGLHNRDTRTMAT
jgi:hypothetical protein